MTATLGEEVYIGCVDISGCGASLVHAVNAATAQLDLPAQNTARIGLAVRTDAEVKEFRDRITVKNCKTEAGKQVSFIGINVSDDDACPPIKVAHAVVKMLRDTQSVQQVTLIGAAHLPGRPQGAVAVATTNGAKAPPELHDCTEIPVVEMLKNEMIASLHYWIAASGIPLVACMAPSNRPPAGLRHRSVDAAACKVLTKAVYSLVKAEVDHNVIKNTVMIGGIDSKSMPVVDSLMYM